MGYAILKVFRFLIRLTKRRYRTMSTRETCEAILDTFTDAQLVNVVAMLQAMTTTPKKATLCPSKTLQKSLGSHYEIQSRFRASCQKIYSKTTSGATKAYFDRSV